MNNNCAISLNSKQKSKFLNRKIKRFKNIFKKKSNKKNLKSEKNAYRKKKLVNDSQKKFKDKYMKTYSNGRYFGNIKNDIREGKGIPFCFKKKKEKFFYFNNGDIYEGDWKDDKMEGREIDMKVIGKMEKEKEKEKYVIIMGIYMKENLSMILLMEKGQFIIMMVQLMKVRLKII